LFEIETEVPANSEVAPEVERETEPAETAVDLETEPAETEAEIEPTAADMVSAARLEQIVNGYSESEFIDIMLATDTHTVDMSRGVAVERVFIAKQVAKRERVAKQAEILATRKANNELATALFTSARQTNVYRAMSELLATLTTRGVVMTLARRTVTVSAVQWVKGSGLTTEAIATFTYADGRYSFKLTGSKSEKYSLEGATVMLAELLPARENVMPRKFRDMLKPANRHKAMGPVDVTGNRAMRNVSGDALSAADLEKYPALAMVQGPKVRTTGKLSMQGVAMTASERRESDRARLKLWRERKRAEKLAAEQASA
jgi:hypothetical protein